MNVTHSEHGNVVGCSSQRLSLLTIISNLQAEDPDFVLLLSTCLACSQRATSVELHDASTRFSVLLRSEYEGEMEEWKLALRLDSALAKREAHL